MPAHRGHPDRMAAGARRAGAETSLVWGPGPLYSVRRHGVGWHRRLGPVELGPLREPAGLHGRGLRQAFTVGVESGPNSRALDDRSQDVLVRDAGQRDMAAIAARSSGADVPNGARVAHKADGRPVVAGVVTTGDCPVLHHVPVYRAAATEPPAGRRQSVLQRAIRPDNAGAHRNSDWISGSSIAAFQTDHENCGWSSANLDYSTWCRNDLAAQCSYIYRSAIPSLCAARPGKGGCISKEIV